MAFLIAVLSYTCHFRFGHIYMTSIIIYLNFFNIDSLINLYWYCIWQLCIAHNIKIIHTIHA